MGGGLLQLVAKGAQDVYLINNPQITLFKNIYHRYTNFSYETFQLNFDGNKNFGEEINCTIPLNGDLLSKTYLVIILNKDTNKNWGYVEKIGFNIINQISISINGHTIDSHTGEWLNIYHEYHKNNGKINSFNILNGNVPELKKIDVIHPEYTLYIPLQFWFCHHYGLSIPVISLEKNSIEIKVKLNKAIDCINYKNNNNNYPSIKDVHLLADYIYLDNIERRKFTEMNHEYLINQVQINKEKIPSYKHSYQLKFFHPSKYLIWLSDQSKYNSRNDFLNWNFNNNWDESKDNFAKLVWLSTRSGLNDEGKYIYYSPNFFNLGDNPDLIENCNESLENLSKKISANLLFYEDYNTTVPNIYYFSNNTDIKIKLVSADPNINLIHNDVYNVKKNDFVYVYNTDTSEFLGSELNYLKTKFTDGKIIWTENNNYKLLFKLTIFDSNTNEYKLEILPPSIQSAFEGLSTFVDNYSFENDSTITIDSNNDIFTNVSIFYNEELGIDERIDDPNITNTTYNIDKCFLIYSNNEFNFNFSNTDSNSKLYLYNNQRAEANIDNVHIIKNNITFEDMSITIDTLKTDTKTSTAQSNFLDLHKVSVISKFNYGNYVNGDDNPIVSSQLKLNGQDRFSKRDGLFFNYIQSKNHFNNIPSDGINIYNFSLNPNELQPSGSCNFSRIDNTTLEITIGNNNTDDSGIYFKNKFKNGNIRFYTNNYNLLKIYDMKAVILYES